MRDPYRACPTQIQPRKDAPGRADCSTSTPEHDEEHTDQEYIWPEGRKAKQGESVICLMRESLGNDRR